MTDKWMDAYAQWAPMQQLLFSALVLGASVFLVVLSGLWLSRLLEQVVALVRGYPPAEAAVPDQLSGTGALEPVAAWTEWTKSMPLRPPEGLGIDWKAEQKASAEGQKEQKVRDRGSDVDRLHEVVNQLLKAVDKPAGPTSQLRPVDPVWNAAPHTPAGPCPEAAETGRAAAADGQAAP
jgi:hypothetical protein